MRRRGFCCRDHFFVCGIRSSKSDVVTNRAAEQIGLLQHDPDLFAQRIDRHVAQVGAIDQNLAAGRIVEARQQVNDRRLAAARHPQQSDRLPRLRLDVDMAQDRNATGITEGDVLELDVALNRRQRPGIRLVGDVALGIEDFEDTTGRGRGLRHLSNDHAQLGHRKEDEDQVQAELLPFADRQRRVDDLITGRIQHRGLAQIGDQEDHREQEGENTRHRDALLHKRLGGLVKFDLLLRFARESFDHLDAGQVFLQNRIQFRQAALHFAEQGLRDRTEDQEQHEGNRQRRQDHQRELEIGQQQNDQRARQEHHGLQRHQQPLADEQPHFFHVVGGADHQLAGLVLVMVTERQALDFGKQIVAHVKGHALRQALRIERLQERKDAAHQCKDQNCYARRD